MISVLDFARLALLIVVLTFSVQANERAKRLVRERLALERCVNAGLANVHGTATGTGQAAHHRDLSPRGRAGQSSPATCRGARTQGATTM